VCFALTQLMERLRQQPSMPLLKMMSRRFANFKQKEYDQGTRNGDVSSSHRPVQLELCLFRHHGARVVQMMVELLQHPELKVPGTRGF
jgi:hypothetical protein